MNLSNVKISDKLVPRDYLGKAQVAQKSKEAAIKEMFENRKLPEKGWSDEDIELLLWQMESLDSNNFVKNAGLGEREAKIACNLVARRHYKFVHGIGRSSDLLEPEKKAVGSTLLTNLTNAFLLELIHVMGLRSCEFCFLLPLATGMALTLCLLSLKKSRPKASYVLWSRIDQKSCFKSITTAGLTPVIVDPLWNAGNGGLNTDIIAFEKKIRELGADNIVCIYSTTSCFAPRNCDDIVQLATMAERYKLPHLVNNAYGLQSTFLMQLLEQAQRLGRVDLFVQSTDKNLMVPVGGAIVAGFNEETVQNVARCYAGRASSSPTLDVFITLLSLGKSGYLNCIKERKDYFEYLRYRLHAFGYKYNATVLDSKRNPITIALTLKNLKSPSKKPLTVFDYLLCSRVVSGVRVIIPGDIKLLDGIVFRNWGTHHAKNQVPYLTVAASVGVTKTEIDTFLKKLELCWNIYSVA